MRERAVELLTERAAEHRSTLHILPGSHGESRARCGDPTAEDCFRQALAVAAELAGPEHPDIAHELLAPGVRSCLARSARI